jgi:phospholipase C
VRFSPAHMKFLPEKIKRLNDEIAKGEEQIQTLPEGEELNRIKRHLDYNKRELEASVTHLKQYTPENYAKLSQHEKNLHEKAFTNNKNDPDYHSLMSLKYVDNGTEREVKIPKGDVLHQFRQDVKSGKLPSVSWLVAPENFSDHPDAPWYGAWYLSEAVDILTENPEVWKKTIFILCYDENDGYFDHVPPFVAPTPNEPSSGKVSKGIDLKPEYVSLEDDLKRKPASHARGGPIGLGYRVPLVIASPWSRGGAVCSQVFDHTSILMFLEKFLSQKTGRSIKETNISEWRRTVCGDLTSAFTPYNGEKFSLPNFVEHDPFVANIHKAQFKKLPSGFRSLTPVEIEQANRTPASSLLPRQENGTRVARALPYELYVDGKLKENKSYEIRFEVSNDAFGASSSGSPFQVYHYGTSFTNRNYAVKAGDVLSDVWAAEAFDQGRYHFRVHGPNGFFREFKGSLESRVVEVSCTYEKAPTKKLTGNVEISISNPGTKAVTVTVRDNAYQQSLQTKKIAPGAKGIVRVNLTKSSGWYDLSVTIEGDLAFENRFAGRVETGKESISDPAMG